MELLSRDFSYIEDHLSPPEGTDALNREPVESDALDLPDPGSRIDPPFDGSLEAEGMSVRATAGWNG
jgi:hypothetical protein